MIYEDAVVIAELPNPGAEIGHIHIKAKKDVDQLSKLDKEEALQLFWTASFAATGVFETLGAQGSNIVLADGQEVELDVYARNQEDGLGLRWEPQQGDKAELEQVAKQVSEAFWYVGKEDTSQPEEKNVVQDEPERVVGEDDQRIQHLKRRY
jgi:diadenosine tetraphosphate (Ap4A) HIT family hydrolase